MSSTVRIRDRRFAGVSKDRDIVFLSYSQLSSRYALFLHQVLLQTGKQNRLKVLRQRFLSITGSGPSSQIP
jgi:hypothetical protein